LSNGWGIVRTAIDLAFKAEDGKYLLMKDPNKVFLSFHIVFLGGRGMISLLIFMNVCCCFIAGYKALQGP
jgi:hypothetical protein